MREIVHWRQLIIVSWRTTGRLQRGKRMQNFPNWEKMHHSTTMPTHPDLSICVHRIVLEVDQAIVILLLLISGAKEDMMARTCVWCDAPLPEPKGKGHRRRDFCNNICKQKHYVWHKQMRHDVAKLEEPFWHNAYRVLVEQYKGLEHRLQITMDHLSKAIIDVEKLQESRKYHMDKLEKMRNDYHARMKAAGMSKQDINEFDDYWKDLFKYDPYGLDLD